MIIRSRVGTARANEKWFRDNVVELHIVPPKPTRYPIYRIEFYLNGASFIGRSTCYFARIVLASGLQLSGPVALRHPQSNENGRYERGEALTENKALSAYFQGRTDDFFLVTRHLSPVTVLRAAVTLAASPARRLPRRSRSRASLPRPPGWRGTRGRSRCSPRSGSPRRERGGG